MNAFEHYREPRRVAAELFRLLKPGGILFLRTAFLQPLHEAPWHFYNCTRYGLTEWFKAFETKELHVSDNFCPNHTLSWIACEAEAALQRDVSPEAANAFSSATIGSLAEMWRDPSKRDAPIWNNFSKLQQSSQEVIAAGFEFRGRKLSTRSERGFKHLDSVISLPLNYELQGVHSVPRVAVLLHAYYLDLLAEFHQALRNIPFPFALFISTDSPEKKAAIEERFGSLNQGPFEVRVFPNRGRDVAPKFVGFRDVHCEYDFVLHIHTKKSLNNPNVRDWRSFLLDCLLGSPQIVAGIFEMFSQRPRLGIVAPRNSEVVRPHMVWGCNFDSCAMLAKRMGIDLRPDLPIDFAAGSMFWARSAALKPLLDLNLTFDCFDEELGQTDGALGHAIERLTFYSCQLAGYTWCHAGPVENPASFENVLKISSRENLHKALPTVTSLLASAIG